MVNRKGTKGQTIQWSIEKEQKDKQYNGQRNKRTNNTMVNRKGTKGQTIQWSIEKEQKDKQYNGQ